MSANKLKRSSVAGLAALVGVTLSALAGCAISTEPASIDTRKGLECVDDSPTCVQRRRDTLAAFLADPSRAWVRDPAGPAAQASGVRLFAYRRLQRQLTCEQLAVGEREAGTAPAVLRGHGGGSLSPAQISRAVMLAGEVGRELAAERRRRCTRAPRARS